MAKEKLENMTDLLKLLGAHGKGNISVSSLSNLNNPEGILSLISKCESLITQLDESDVEVISELMLTLSKLKVLLLYLFKKRQRKLIELHWDQLEKESEQRVKKQTKKPLKHQI